MHPPAMGESELNKHETTPYQLIIQTYLKNKYKIVQKRSCFIQSPVLEW